jgi:aminoglycoside 3-N-acetyltransferase
MKGFVKSVLPTFVVNLLMKIKKNARAKKVLLEKERGNVLTDLKIEEALLELGVKSGDTIMLHSSLRSMGYVEGGPGAVINAFQKVIGDNGTLVMPSFPALGFSYDYLKSNPIFSAKETPSRMGVITEYFRKSKDVVRSLHPTDPVVARGRHAIYLTASHFNQLTPYNKSSPFSKLCELNAKIVLLGVDFNSLTNLHTAEDAIENFPVSVYHTDTFKCIVKDINGTEHEMITKVHDPKWSRKRKCNAFIPLLLNCGLLKKSKVGSADVYMIGAYDLHQWFVDSYHKKGITLYSPEGKSGE